MGEGGYVRTSSDQDLGEPKNSALIVTIHQLEGEEQNGTKAQRTIDGAGYTKTE
jgi:hypothetical protein